jgi:hypothetical protein
MSTPTPVARPGSVTVVMVLTWVAAILSILGGVLFLLAGDEALEQAGVAASTATTYAWVEIGWGVVAALVAIGLGNGNNFSRLLVTVLMVLRIAAAVWAAIALSGTTGFWAIALAAGFAVLVLALLWNNRANMFFATN